MLPPLSLLLPSTAGHKWLRPLSTFYAMACQRRAPERATVLPRTVAALCPSHPTTSSLPLAPVEVPRRPQHATVQSPSSLPLSHLLWCVPRAAGSANARPRTREHRSLSLLPLSLPGALPHPHECHRQPLALSPGRPSHCRGHPCCRSACSSQCNQKTDLMEETRQHIIRQHSPSRVAPSSGLNMDRKWAAI